MSRIYRGLSKVEINYLCPMIAMISSGKTKTLRVIYDIDFLEVSAGIGTKFVNIIRYNPKVGNEPKFYHLLVKKLFRGKYEFYKDPNFKDVIGSENIKKLIKELNEKYKSKENIPYEDLFYMVEVGHPKLISDEEYLKKFDLVDIPGLSEYKFQEKNKGEAPVAGKENKNIYDSIDTTMKSYDPNSEQTYLTEFFKIMKAYIINGIIVFSVDNLQIAENYEIIGKLQKVLDRPIEKFLVLLNKIDKSDDVCLEIATLEGKILKNFPSAKLFNFNKNTLVPISAYQLENESKIESSFHYFLNYHFLNFLMSLKKDTPGNPNITTNGLSFVDFLKKINPLKNITKKKYEDWLNKILNDKNLEKILEEIKSIIEYIIANNKSIKNLNLGVRPDDFEKSKIEKFKQKIKEDNKENEEEEEEEGEKEAFNINDQDEKGIILYYYSLFANKNKKVIPEKSEEYLKIVNYFKIENFIKVPDPDEEKRRREFKNYKEKYRIIMKKINDLSTEMKEFYDKISKEATRQIDIKALNQHINNSINILKASQYFYIPLLGCSNAGKSTTLNTFIGFKLLPAHKNECTKKGILIKHWNWPEPALRRTYFREVENINNEKMYCFEPEDEEIASGVEEIQRTLEASNYEFSQNEEDFFFEIDVNMRFIEELNIDNDLKEKICFIDLPGYGTNNEFEGRDIYTNLIKSCNLFIFVVFNLTIKENNNQNMLNKLLQRMTISRGVTTKSFLKKCLFIVNADEKQEISEKTLNQAKADILSITTNKVDKNDFKHINVCFYNALLYENYLYKLMYYQSGVNIIKTEYMAYKNEKAKFFKNLINNIMKDSFNKHLLKTLKVKIKNDIQIPFEEEEVKPNKSLEESINNFLEKNSLKFKPVEITLISKYITFGRENIINSNLKFESKYDEFKNILYNCIKEAKSNEDKEINENLLNCFKIFDIIFDVDPDTKFGQCRNAPIPQVIKPHMEDDIDKMKLVVEKYLDLINKEFIVHDVSRVLDESSKNIIQSLTKEKSDISYNLKNKHWKEIKKQFKEVFETKTDELKIKLIDILETSTKNLKTSSDECYDSLDKFYLKPCKKKNKLYKNYIAKKLGGDDKIEQTIEDIKTDIIKASNTATDWENNSTFGWFKQLIFDEHKLNRIIDCIISESISRINSFCISINNLSSKYKTMLINEIQSSKNRVEKEMEERKNNEKIEMQMIQAKNEGEKKKWESEKKILDSKKKFWEDLCRRYRQLRDKFIEIRFTSI